MATERIVVDANCPQVRKKRNRAPKPWVIAGSKTTPTFETREGRDVAHVGYELELVPDDPSKLTNSARKLYFRLDDMGSLLYFSSERDGKLVSSTGVPGYAVFPIGFMLNGFDLKQSDKQTQYKRAWQMTYEEWKEGQQLTCETDDARLFWSAVHAFMEKFKEGGRARKSRRIAKEPEAGSIQSTVSTPETEGTPDTPATDLHPESRSRTPTFTSYHHATVHAAWKAAQACEKDETFSTMDTVQHFAIAAQLRHRTRSAVQCFSSFCHWHLEDA